MTGVSIPVIHEAGAPFDPPEDPPSNLAGAYRALLPSRAGGLTRFGASLETLYPGARSSICHWHAACFKAGTPLGHFLENTGTEATRYLIVGIRERRDRITYPDSDQVQVVDRESGTRVWTTLAGDPADNPYLAG